MSQRLPGDQRAAPPAQVRAGRGEAKRGEAGQARVSPRPRDTVRERGRGGGRRGAGSPYPPAGRLGADVVALYGSLTSSG